MESSIVEQTIPVKYEISEDDAIDDPYFRDKYMAERKEAIERGEAVWLITDFDALDRDPISEFMTEFFKEGVLKGEVRMVNSYGGYSAYITDSEHENEPKLLNDKPIIYLKDAKALVEEAVAYESSTLVGRIILNIMYWREDRLSPLANTYN